MAAEIQAKGVKDLVDSGIRRIPEAYIRPEQERPTASEVLFSESIPVLDLQHLEGPTRAELVDSISRACQDWGFFQVINHGVPERVIRGIEEAAHEFFRLPEDEKAKYQAQDHRAPVGYGTSFTAKDEKILEWRDFLYLIGFTDPEIVNSWPPVLRDAAVEYMSEVRKLATRLLSALSESLGLPGVLEKKLGHERLWMNYYPPCPNPDLAFGVSGHSDVGLLTILLQDEVGGLQVVKDGRWVAVQPIRSAFVVNVADMLQVLSNGKFQSAEHRAVTSYNRTRLSIAMFCAPHPTAEMKPIPELINPENPLRYRTFTFAEYLQAFMNKSHAGKASNLDFAKIDN